MPSGERLLRTRVIVHAAEQGDVFVAEADGEKQASQVLLGSDRLGKHDGLAAAATVPPQIKNHFDRFLEGARLGIVWKRLRSGDKTLDAHKLRGEGYTIDLRGRFLERYVDLILVLKILEHVNHCVVGT